MSQEDPRVVGLWVVREEAMRNKNVIRSPRAGEVAAVRVPVGQHVKHNQVLVEYAGQRMRQV
jgi:biotin carboxyl carrier protein